MIKGLQHLPYMERLKCLGLFNLEKTMTSGLQGCKIIMHGVEKMNRKNLLFSLSLNSQTQGDPMKLLSSPFRTD